jgi:hypothetical protein
MFQQSYVGAMFTGGHPAEGRSGQTYGADMRLATSRFLGRPNSLVVNAYGVRSVNEGFSGRDWSYGFSARYPNDRFNAQVAFREIQANFRPALVKLGRRPHLARAGLYAYGNRSTLFRYRAP